MQTLMSIMDVFTSTYMAVVPPGEKVTPRRCCSYYKQIISRSDIKKKLMK